MELATLMGRVGRSWVGISAVLLGLGLGAMTPAIAAETVLLRYRGFGRAIPVADLATLAETGEVSEALDGLLVMAGQDPEALRALLTRPLTADPNLLDDALNHWTGEWVLDQVGTAIHPPSGEASRQALRSAIMLSVADDGQMTLLEVMERYPTPEVVVEGDRIENAYTNLQILLAPVGGI